MIIVHQWGFHPQYIVVDYSRNKFCRSHRYPNIKYMSGHPLHDVYHIMACDGCGVLFSCRIIIVIIIFFCIYGRIENAISTLAFIDKLLIISRFPNLLAGGGYIGNHKTPFRIYWVVGAIFYFHSFNRLYLFNRNYYCCCCIRIIELR